MVKNNVIEGLDNAVNAFVSRTLIFQDDAWMKNRCRAFVLQHRQNNRHRNSVLKLKVATNCPIWDIKLDIIDACSQELWNLSDDDVGFFKLHTEADLEHSGLGLRNAANYADDLNLEDELVASCRRNLVVWKNYFNGICYLGDSFDQGI